MIIKKFVLFLFVFATVITISNTSKVEAAPVFPSGCSSAIGYSITTGYACNGTSSATMTLQGCTTPLGYSITNGAPCSGASEAIAYLNGCTSIYGYSTITSAPCNGTSVATPNYTTPVTPGLPTTGTGGMTNTNIALLLSLGLVSLAGIIYSVRKTKLV